MSSYNKPYLTFDQQLELLKSRGLEVTNHQTALMYLKRVGYYRLSGYWYPFREMIAPNELQHAPIKHLRKDNFVINSKLQDVINLYIFDKKLRILLLDAIERIEVSVRVNIAYLLGKYDRFAYLNPELLHGHFVKKRDSRTGKTVYDKWLVNLEQLIGRSHEDFVKHYKEKYGLPLPIWVAIELWDFGMLSKFYQGMRVNDKLNISKQYGISDWRVMQSWLRTLNYIRNCVAHHNRLWNRNLLDRPKLPAYNEIISFNPLLTNKKTHTRIYVVLCIVSHLLQNISPKSSWNKRLFSLMETFPKTSVINISSMGFPEDWKHHNFWDNVMLRKTELILEAEYL